MTIAKNASSTARKQRSSPPRDVAQRPSATLPQSSGLSQTIVPRLEVAQPAVRPSSPNASVGASPALTTSPLQNNNSPGSLASSPGRIPTLPPSPLGAGGELAQNGSPRLHNSDDESDPRIQASGYRRIVDSMLNSRQPAAHQEQGSLMHEEETEASTLDMPLPENTVTSEQTSSRTHLSWDELDIIFEEELWQNRGLVIRPMGEDGACLFRAVADQVYGDQECHNMVRQHCCDYLTKNKAHYGAYLTSGEEIVSYIRRKRLPRIHGNHLEVQAMSEMYNRPFEVYEYSCLPLKCVSVRNENTTRNPIRVSYHRKCHFNSLYDPHASPRLGIGLGLSKTFKSSHSLQVELKRREREISKLESNMMNDKMLETDLEISEKELLEQALRESRQMAYQEASGRSLPRKRSASSGMSSSKISSKRSKSSQSKSVSFAELPTQTEEQEPCCSKTLDVDQPSTSASSSSISRTITTSSQNSLTNSNQSSVVNDLEMNDDDMLQHILELSKREF